MYRIYFLLISKCGLRKRVRIGLIEPRKLCMKQSNIFEKKMKSKFPMSIESETQRPKNWFTVYEEWEYFVKKHNFEIHFQMWIAERVRVGDFKIFRIWNFQMWINERVRIRDSESPVNYGLLYEATQALEYCEIEMLLGSNKTCLWQYCDCRRVYYSDETPNGPTTLTTFDTWLCKDSSHGVRSYSHVVPNRVQSAGVTSH